MSEFTIDVNLSSADLAESDSPLLFIALGSNPALPVNAGKLDSVLAGAISTAITDRAFRGSRDEVYYLSGGATGPKRVGLVGMGKGDITAASVKRAASVVARQAVKLGTGRVAFAFGTTGTTPSEFVEAAAVGLNMGAWKYSQTISLPPESERRLSLSSATIVAEDSEQNRTALEAGVSVAAGYGLTRIVAMLPGNICTPDYLAGQAEEVAKRYGMKFTSLDRAGMTEEKMGAFLGVAQGTPQEPRFVAMEYNGGKAGDAPYVLVGKGLCFDTGGISLKPALNMEWMKFDMSGAAAVLGAMEAVGRLKLPINVVGVFGATTNMPSGTALKPGDVVQAQNGKYIEIINTDAEGRLVLADLLSYVSRYNPAAVIDAATLTGAMVIGLGTKITGVFGTDQQLVADVISAGNTVGEDGWEMPMYDDYKELISSDIADVKNTGGRSAGSITAALFLKEFVADYPWAHLDVAGSAYSESDLGWLPKGPTGRPVGTMIEFLRNRAAR